MRPYVHWRLTAIEPSNHTCRRAAQTAMLKRFSSFRHWSPASPTRVMIGQELIVGMEMNVCFNQHDGAGSF